MMGRLPWGISWRRGAFERGKVPIIYYNPGHPIDIGRDFPNPFSICIYCREIDYATKEYPQLIEKWKENKWYNI